MLRLTDSTLAGLLADDVPHGDLTTRALGIGKLPARLTFNARQPMTVAATEEAARLFELAGAQAHLLAPSGVNLQVGDAILSAHGSAESLHSAWKASQTLVEWASGIATATAAMVAVAKGVPVACTRKNVPGTKALSVKAVLAGGGVMHRLGLSDTILLFAEHRTFLLESPHQTVARLRSGQPEKKVVVEVASVEEALVWAMAGADVLQLEKFTPETLAACRMAICKDMSAPPQLAAAGGVHAGNAASYVAAGADLLVTSAPYAAPPKDVQVNFSGGGYA